MYNGPRNDPRYQELNNDVHVLTIMINQLNEDLDRLKSQPRKMFDYLLPTPMQLGSYRRTQLTQPPRDQRLRFTTSALGRAYLPTSRQPVLLQPEELELEKPKKLEQQRKDMIARQWEITSEMQHIRDEYTRRVEPRNSDPRPMLSSTNSKLNPKFQVWI
jgi:hypothetical protein